MLNGIRNAVMIYNPLSGSGRGRRVKQLDAARRILAGAGIEVELQATTGPGAATKVARQAVEQGCQLVIVCGGDGTVNEAVNGVACSQVPLAVLPAGTANVLAKELSIPWDIPRAAAMIPAGRLERIALGLAAPLGHSGPGRYFLCVAGAGPDGVMVYSLDTKLKLRAGIAAYWFEGFRQLFRYNFPRFRVSAAGREIEATLVIVGRTKNYGGPFRITTQAELLENQFELAVLTTRSAARYLSYLPAVWLGRLRQMEGVHFWKTTSVRCDPLDDAAVYAQVDGEPSGRLPLEFRIVPEALTLVVPEAFSSQRSTISQHRRAPAEPPVPDRGPLKAGHAD